MTSKKRESKKARKRVRYVLAFLLAASCGREDTTGFTAQGTVEVREIDVAPLSVGRVVQVLVDEGDAVAAGDTVVILTAPTLDADLDAARARLAVATAALRDLEAGARTQELGLARAELAAVRADAARLAKDRERLRALLDAGAIAPREFDAADAAATVAAARVRSAEESLSLLEAGPRAGRVAAAQAEVASARAALAGREASTAEFVVTAPLDGVVLSRVADPGDLLSAGTAAVVLGVMREPWVRVYVPASVLPSIAVGAEAEIHPPGAGGRVAEGDGDGDSGVGRGRVVAINPQAEYVTRTALTEEERADLLFGVKVAITDPAGRFKPGLPVTVRLALQGSGAP
jgi:HlyD family secretion protein